VTAWFAHGLVLDWLVAGMLAEAAVLLLFHRLTGRGVAAREFLANLLSGLCLLLAMRLALSGAWWVWVSASLLAALLLHVGDLRRRWR
jgi:hypothetical protein